MRHFFEFSGTPSQASASGCRVPIDHRTVARPSSVAALALTSTLLLPAPATPADAAGVAPAQAKQSTGAVAPEILLAQSQAEPADEPAEVRLRFGRHQDYDRFVFEWTAPVEADVFKSGGELLLTFGRSGEVDLPSGDDLSYLADSLPQLVFGVRAEDGGRRYRISMERDARFRVHRWNDGRLIVLDLLQAAPADESDARAVVDAEPEAEAPAVELEPQPEPEPVAPIVEDEPDSVDEEVVDQDVEPEAVIDDGPSDDQEEEEDEQPDNFVTSGAFTVELGGSLQFGVSTAQDERLSDGEGDRGYTFFTDTDLDLSVYTTLFDETDVGAYLSLEADADIDDDTANADEVYLYVDDGFGLVQIGRTSGAEDDMALGADTIATGTGGIDGDTANLGDTQVETSGDAAKISYFTPRVSGFQAGISYAPDTGDEEDGADDGADLENYVGLGLNYVETYGDVELSIATVGSFAGSEDTSADDLSAFAVGGTVGFDPVELGASYGRSASDLLFDYHFATAGITYGFDQVSAGIGYNYVDEKSDGTTHIFALSGSASILPGVELQGDLSYADADKEDGNVASVLAIELSY